MEQKTENGGTLQQKTRDAGIENPERPNRKHGTRAGARTLIGGVYIHIFRFCRLVSFVIKLISKEISRA